MKTNIPTEISSERQAYLKARKHNKDMTALCRWSLLIGLLVLWELSAEFEWIDSFIMSSPSRMAGTFCRLLGDNLALHVGVTLYETLTGFLLGAAGGTLIAVALWWSPFLSRVLEPYLVVLNSLPKIALGPVIIIWVGAGTRAIVVMALAISMIVTVMEMLAGFLSTDRELLQMASTFGASKAQLFTKIVFPSNIRTLFNSLKVNIGLSLVGVIAGEFLISKAGLGYLIVYGGQVFQLDLVMTSVVILSVVAALMYQGIVMLEKYITRRFIHSA